MPPRTHDFPGDPREASLLDAIDHQAILLLGADGNILSWHAGAARLTGFSADEALGRHASMLYAADAIASGALQDVLDTAALRGRASADHWQRHKNGSLMRTNLTVTPIRRTTHRRPLGFAAVIRENPLTGQSIEGLAAELQQTREDEQRRIAQALHDDLGQQLAALKMGIVELQAQLHTADALQAQTAPLTHELQRLVDVAVASLRRIATGLHPIVLETLGLVPALEWLVDDFSQRYGIAVRARIDANGPPLHDDIAAVLFRAAQEALLNVARHAHASTVRVALTRRTAACVLTIDDDGRGIATDTRAPSGTSMGLRGMRERVRRLGGTLDIRSAPGRGTRLTISLPPSPDDAQRPRD